jgi:hypothetical protein
LSALTTGTKRSLHNGIQSQHDEFYGHCGFGAAAVLESCTLVAVGLFEK